MIVRLVSVLTDFAMFRRTAGHLCLLCGMNLCNTALIDEKIGMV